MSGLLDAVDNLLGSPSQERDETTTDKAETTTRNGLIQVSVPNLLPTSLPNLLNPSKTSSDSAAPTSTSTTKPAAVTTSSRSSTRQSTPTPTPTSAPTVETTPPPASTPSPSTTLPLSLSTSETSSLLPTGTGIIESPVAKQQELNSMDPMQNPTMMALIITIPIATLILAGVSFVLWRGGCLRCGRRKKAIIKDEMEHEAYSKVHAEKFGPSQNY